ncbi:MAG: pyridoxamine 5'-phosphate oxidase [Betaproteobacteria bacterium]|nr:pyridoxamine 5'-phosphate oxidase [Betaproteobacteria bacterium]
MSDAPRPLSERNVERDPIAQFARWYERALGAVKPMPEAVALATATRAGQPSLRMVLLKGFDARGFVFYTNYDSRKGRELARNARASLMFYWGELNWQVRVEGRVARLAPQESDDYFVTRPRGSQLAAWASPQSRLVAGRAALERRVAALARRHPGAVPRPPYWGGYRLLPEAVEFWEGREDRLHDRIRYRRARGGGWTIERLAP